MNEAGTDVFPDKIFWRIVDTVLRDLDLKFAATEPKVHHRFATGASTIMGNLFFRGYLSREPSCSAKSTNAGIVLLDLVPSGDPQVDLALSDECWYVRCREEDESDGQILHKGYIETVFPPELDIGTFEEIKSGLIQSALCSNN